MTTLARFIVPALAGFFVAVSVHAQNLTVQIGSPAPPPVPLVNHGDSWRYHKGTNAPVVGWQTNADAVLGGQWLTGNGGIGYSTDTVGETNKCQTILTDMRNLYSTLYFRRTFQILSTVDPTAHLQLTMDYDDGFVAYLDGAEIQRANAGGTVGVEPPNTQLAPVTHESSLGTAGAAPVVYDLGAVGSRLAVGTHVLAFIGINNTLASSDLIMVPDLAVISTIGGGVVPNNGLYALVNTNNVLLSGSNTVAGSTRVTINGEESIFNAGQGTWTNTFTLTPGYNRLFIAALDASGHLLSNITQDIIYETTRIDIGGTLASSLLASNRGTVLYVTNTVFVPTNMTLEIANGAVVLVSPNQSIFTRAGGHINVHGTFADRVFFNINGASNALWGPISGTGTNATILLQFADITHAQVNATTNAYGLFQDCAFHDFDPGAAAGTLNRPIVHCNYASLFEARRIHVWNYYECLVRNGLIQIEHCLFERMSGDALDFDSAQPGSFVRRCTYRHGDLGNVDAVDIGPGELPGSTDTRIEDSIMWDFPFDKGVSNGDDNSSHGIIVSNCLIYSCFSGVMSKTLCDVSVRNCTIVDCASGLTNYNKANPASPTGGGITTNTYNNIVWYNSNSIGMANSSQLYADHNDFMNTNWPGVGNFSADPLFVDPAHRNYRLQPGSPCLGVGRAGADLGIIYPLGGIPAPPFALAVVVLSTNAPVLSWIDDSQNEDGVVVQRSSDAINWQMIAALTLDATNYTDLTAVYGLKYYYRVQHTNYVGASLFSNIASTPRLIAIVAGGNVGGTITSDTCWAGNGVFTVTSSITVPAGVTLYIKPGAQVQFNSGLKMTVNGQLMAIGAPTNRLRLTKSGANTWGGLDFINAPLESRIEYADFDSCAGTTVGGHAAEIHVNGASKVFFNWLNFANVPAQEYISFDGSTFIVQNSTFPTYPWATSAPEMLHGVNGINAGGYGIFRSNYFGHTFGFNDTIDFTGGQRPGPILQFIGNVFDGAGDDHLDLDSADAWIEGNIFMHVHRDPNRTDRADDTGSAISGGVDFDGQFSEWTVINNLFYDVDHVCLNKGGAGTGAGRFIFVNNTVVHVNQESGAGPSTNIAAFIFTDDQVAFPGATYGAGAYVANNIFWDCPMLATNYNVANHTIIFENNIVPGAWGGAGSNNVVTDPLLNLQLITTVTNATAAQVRAAFMPKTNSPALASGFGAKYDKGGIQPLGMMIYGEPTNSASSNATLIVGPIEAWRVGSAVPAYNAGYTSYKWKLDNGPWSAELSTTNSPTISLSNLSSGPHTVYVVGKNDAGYYQDDPFVYPTDISLIAAHATASRTWVVGLDTDGDGLPDEWEDTHGLNKLVNDAGLDPDGDGMTNLQEYLAGTDPQVFGSSLRLFNLSESGGSVSFSFVAVSNKTYTVQHRTSLSTGSWLRLQDISTAAFNRLISVTNAPGTPTRFYQVVTPIAP